MGIDNITLSAAKNYVDETLIGAGGLKGEDGFSPVVAVKESSDTVYKLEITTAAAKFETPNLMASVTVEDTLSADSVNPVQNKAIVAALASKANLSDIPESLPADGGNADTVDGLHADDFVLSGREQLEVPSGADVPVWIRNNGKRYTVYSTVGTDNGYSNVPNNDPNHVWYVYNGNILWAYVYSERRLYFCDVVNGVFSGWQATFTSQHMPYVTGTFSGITSGQSQTVPLSFTPSLAFCWWGTNSPRMCIPTANGFTAVPDTTGGINYVAFR